MSTTVKILDQQPFYNAAHLAAHLAGYAQTAKHHDVVQEITRRLTSRLDDITRAFPNKLILAPQTSTVTAPHHPPQSVRFNPEHPYPFPADRFDVIISHLLIPWLNQLSACFHYSHQCLKPDGLLLMSTLGAGSFSEFTASFAGIGITTPCCQELPTLPVLGTLMQQTGFTLPVIDRDTITLTYPDFTSLYADLRNMGSKNLHPARYKGLVTPRQMQRMEDIYRREFAENGDIPVTLEVLYLHGWKHHASQQQPLKPGSATSSLSAELSKNA